jgi:RHS repeat-associated protein
MPALNQPSQPILDALARDLHRRQLPAALEKAGFTIARNPNEPDAFTATDAESRQLLMRFEPDGAIVATSADGRTIKRWFDAYGRLIRVIDAAGVDTRFIHKDTDLTIDRGAFGVHVIRQDAFGELVSVEFPDGSRSTIDWDEPAGEVITSRAGARTQRLRDESGVQTGAIDERGGRTIYREDQTGADAFVERRSPTGRHDRYELDEAGNLRGWFVDGHQIAWAEGRSIGQLPARIRWADGRWAEYAVEKGSIVAARGPAGAVRIDRDGQGRQIAEVRDDGVAIRYSRDRTGLLTGIAILADAKIGFGYDAAGALDNVVDWEGRVTRLAWSLSGQLSSVTHPNGAVTEIESDPIGRILKHKTRSGGKMLHQARYAYDRLDRVVSEEDTGGTRQYKYDGVDRLIAVTSSDPDLQENWTLDAAGNCISHNGRRFAADPDNKLTGEAGDTIAYDALGPVAEMRLPNGRRGRLTHDGRGQLVRIDFDDGRVAEYAYDPFGRRVMKRVDGRTTRYIWAGTTLASEVRDPGPGWTRRDHLFLPDLYYPLAMRVDGRIVRLHCDRRGAPIAATGSSGEILWKARLKAFGEALVEVDGIEQPWRLPGQYCDEESGLYYNLARHYHPGLGRYLSQDPLFDPITRGNLYLYAAGDPVNRADPTGEFVIPLAIIAAVLIGAAVGAAIGAGVKIWETRGQDWNAARWKEIGKGAAVGGIAGAVGGAVGWLGLALAGGATATVGALMAVGFVEGAATSVAQDCAEAKFYDKMVSGKQLLLDAAVGGAIGAVTAGVGALASRALMKNLEKQGGKKLSRLYAHLEDPENVAAGNDFTAAQKAKIIKENMKRNEGSVRSDQSGKLLKAPAKSRRGVTPDPDEWQIDHVVPKDKGGTNSYSNAQVLSRAENRAKWNK